METSATSRPGFEHNFLVAGVFTRLTIIEWAGPGINSRLVLYLLKGFYSEEAFIRGNTVCTCTLDATDERIKQIPHPLDNLDPLVMQYPTFLVTVLFGSFITTFCSISVIAIYSCTYVYVRTTLGEEVYSMYL